MTTKFAAALVFLSVQVIVLLNCEVVPVCSDGKSRGDCTLSGSTVGYSNENATVLPTEEMTTHTAKPNDKPKALSMLAEPETHTAHPKNTSLTEEPKGRSLNFTHSELSHQNVLPLNASARDEFGDLSDVSMDGDDPQTTPNNKTLLGICEKGGLTYENGEKLESGCDSVCTCENGKMDCVDRCTGPYVQRGKRIEDPLCTAKSVEDPCCAILVCAADTETEPLEICHYNNKTYNRGDQFKKDCSEICTCEAAGKLSCKPRCAPVNKTSDRCVEIPDPLDSCCKTVLCDVTLDDHEPEKDAEETTKPKILSAKLLNATTIKIKFDATLEEKSNLPMVQLSDDKTNWKSYKIIRGGLVRGFKDHAKYIKLEDTEDIVEIQNAANSSANGTTCTYKGKSYHLNEEFNDDCESLCACRANGVQCLKLECPTYFGVDVIDPNCVEWETIPPNFKPQAPNCCPQELKCKNNGSCIYENQMYQNWQQLPSNITGCEKRCYCEMGNVECHNSCPPVPAVPPADLDCLPQFAILSSFQEDDCCKYWVCSQTDSTHGPPPNETKNDKKGLKNKTKPTETPFVEQHTKTPSKVLGPLVVYGNDEMSHNKSSKPTHVVLDENPFYHKEKDNKKKGDAVVTTNKTQFLGPLNPESGQTETKPNKNSKVPAKNKTKPNLTFVTPPPTSATENQKNVYDRYNPENSLVRPQKPTAFPPRIQIHAKGNPEEILQYINQHPDLNNYPPGSVIEITNVSPHDNLQRPIRPHFINPNSIQNSGGQPQIVPFHVNNGQQSVPIPGGLPPGITIEQILQEIQKSEQLHPTNPYQSVYPQTNGQIYVAPQNGPILPTRPITNATYEGGHYPGILSNIPDYQRPQNEIVVQNLEAVDAHTVRLVFSVPAVYVGLHGRVEVRYTYMKDENPDNWELQIFAPPNDLIATPQLEFDLLDLKPNTEYKMKIIITLRDLHNTPSSKVYTIRTLKEAPMTTTLPPMIPIEPNLAISDINATWVNVMWRKFSEYELQFIDGVQLRYKEIDGKIYAATPLIHRAVTTYTLENLRPNTKYELGIYFIPFPGQLSELHAGHMIHFTTANEIDTYGFNVTLNISHTKATSVEIAWSGVPYPEDKYVYIYRAIYQSDNDKGDYSTFKVAKRDSPAKTVVMNLKPGTRYRLWLEVYLTNGKIKTSNVQDFITKPRGAPTTGAAQQDKLAYSEYPDHKGDYYGPLVVVAILAAIAILSTLILLLILVRRHGQNKAAITPPTRVSQSAYDNPTYKVEIQQETMGL